MAYQAGLWPDTTMLRDGDVRHSERSGFFSPARSGTARGAGVILLLGTVLAGCADTSSGTTARNTEKVADAALGVGDYAEAARLYERATASAPRSVPALLGLGRAYGATGQFVRAQNALESALKVEPRNEQVLVELGHLQLEQMHPRDALEYYDKALKTDGRNKAALTGKGVALDYLSRHTEAQQVYQQALALYPTDFPLLSDYALSRVLSGNIGEGIRLMEQLLRDPSKGTTVRANMALAYALDGREADARAVMSGDMSGPDIDRTLAYYRLIRKDYLAGKPIGYMVFR